MILYQIQDEKSGLWYRPGRDRDWVVNQQDALGMLNEEPISTLHSINHMQTKRKAVIRKFDPFAALCVLQDLNELMDFNWFTTCFRDKEKQLGWQDACTRAERLLK